MGYTKSCEKELAFQADRRKATTEFIKVTNDLCYENDYSHQAIRLAKHIAKVRRFTYY